MGHLSGGSSRVSDYLRTPKGGCYTGGGIGTLHTGTNAYISI